MRGEAQGDGWYKSLKLTAFFFYFFFNGNNILFLLVNGIYPHFADDIHVYFCCGWNCHVCFILQVWKNWPQVQAELQVWKSVGQSVFIISILLYNFQICGMVYENQDVYVSGKPVSNKPEFRFHNIFQSIRGTPLNSSVEHHFIWTKLLSVVISVHIWHVSWKIWSHCNKYIFFSF